MRTFPLLRLPTQCQYSMLVHAFREGIASTEKVEKGATSVQGGMLPDDIMRRVFKQAWLRLHPDKHTDDQPEVAKIRLAAWRQLQIRKELLLHTTRRASVQRRAQAKDAFQQEQKAAAAFLSFFKTG